MGRACKILRGPYSGFKAEAVADEGDKLRVKVTMFGQPMEVSIDKADVEGGRFSREGELAELRARVITHAKREGEAEKNAFWLSPDRGIVDERKAVTLYWAYEEHARMVDVWIERAVSERLHALDAELSRATDDELATVFARGEPTWTPPLRDACANPNVWGKWRVAGRRREIALRAGKLADKLGGGDDVPAALAALTHWDFLYDSGGFPYEGPYAGRAIAPSDVVLTAFVSSEAWRLVFDMDLDLDYGPTTFVIGPTTWQMQSRFEDNDEFDEPLEAADATRDPAERRAKLLEDALRPRGAFREVFRDEGAHVLEHICDSNLVFKRPSEMDYYVDLAAKLVNEMRCHRG